jgi:hypothetical protein
MAEAEVSEEDVGRKTKVNHRCPRHPCRLPQKFASIVDG